MVEMVRSGFSQRYAARKFRVSIDTIQRWLKKSKGLALSKVDWSDRSRAPHRVHNRTMPEMEQMILECRRKLGSADNPLGFVGPEAICEALTSKGILAPHPRTVARILKRHGVLDSRVRRRFSAPPTGWYLPNVAKELADIDFFDVIEDLAIEGKGRIDALTSTTLWGPFANVWPAKAVGAKAIIDWLTSYWRVIGLPTYTQFDNDTRFQGGHNHPGVVGRVIRLCLSLGIIPVFAPPQETGFQANIEHFNGLWEKKVWYRFHHENSEALCACSERFINAYVRRRAMRADRVPERKSFPESWKLNLQRHPSGKLVYIRRTDGRGNAFFLGRSFAISHHWLHRLVRCEVNLDCNIVSVFRLRRSEPEDQPLLTTIEYHLPKRRFLE